MKIDEIIVNYEIGKQLPKSIQNEMEKVEEKLPSGEEKVQDQSGQDAIVNLSPALKEAQTIKEVISSEPDIREDKVAEIIERIDSGEYNIDNDAVAGKMVDAFLEETF